MPYSADKRLDELTAHATVTANDLFPVQDEGTGDLLKAQGSAVATFVLAQTTFTDHSARHENGGADEISVAGLSGLLADGQTPLAHATSHKSGGSDAVKLDELAAPTDVTTLNASTTAHGLLPKLDNVATTFLNGQGAFATPDHGSVGGLTDDDHSQYSLLAGRAGGQTIIGGVAASENLTLKGTSHATPGKVVIGDGTSAVLQLGHAHVQLILNNSPVNQLEIVSQGTTMGRISGSGFDALVSGTVKARLASVTASATVPNLLPEAADGDTGIGKAGADQLSLIAGGAEGLRVEATVITPAGRVLGKQGADVASANDITLGNGNYFDITGTTQINTIASTGWTAGSLVTLQFDGSVTVAHNTAGAGAILLLAGAANFSATAGDTLTLRYDGAAWRECARTVI